MKRLYYLTDSVQSADTMASDLREAGVDDSDIHVLGPNERDLLQHHLHPASVFQRTDLIRSIERTLMVGCALALLFTLPLNYLAEFRFSDWLLVSISCLVLALVIGVIGGLSQENYQIERFHEAIVQGRLMVIVDCTAGQTTRVRTMMNRHHPEARLEGIGSSLVNPFTDSIERVPVRS
jgi:hypothetical protein